MEWVRGAELGRGSFATVNLAIPKPTSRYPHHPSPMVVKSSDFSASESLQNESEILRRLDGRCRQVIRCFADSRTTDNGRDVYNLFLEYASGGSLADQLRRRPLKRFAEFEVRRHANSILRGLKFIHDSGIVHCDVKLQNILVFDDGDVKISDFGLAKEESDDGNGGFEIRGTPMYMAPEVVAGGSGKAAADVWAFGCAVVEMATGRPAWRREPGCGVGELLCRIGVGSETPEIPENLSEEGKDFVSKCLAKDPKERWTARMLLGHPFVSGLGEEQEQLKTTSSPRGPFDFPDVSELCSTASFSSEQPCLKSALNRVGKVAGDPVEWSDLDGWVAVRRA